MSELSCPRCKVTMEVKIHEEIDVDACPKCKGVWVEHADERQALKIMPQTFTMDELKRLRKAYEPYAKRDPICYLSCPVCKDLMNRRNWGSHSGVIVDKCDEHGTWYDDGEIEKIQEFIEHGGIEFEKMRAPEKANSQLQSKLGKEALRLDKKIDSAYRRARLFSLFGL